MPNRSATTDPAGTDRCMLWVDGVGGFLACLSEDVSLGGVGPADISVQSNLSRRQGSFRFREDRWWWQSLKPFVLNDVDYPLGGEVPLADQSRLRFGNAVSVEFRRPHALSQTALVRPTGTHRLAGGVDEVILMRQNCLFGAERFHHVRSADWSDNLILIHSSSGLSLKATRPERLKINHQPVAARENGRPIPLEPGDVVTGEGFQFRIAPP